MVRRIGIMGRMSVLRERQINSKRLMINILILEIKVILEMNEIGVHVDMEMFQL